MFLGRGPCHDIITVRPHKRTRTRTLTTTTMDVGFVLGSAAGLLKLIHPMEHGIVSKGRWSDMEKVWNYM